MKKILLTAVLLLTAALSLTSCGGDDEPKVKTTATTMYFMTFSPDLLEAASVIIYYKAENGRTTFDPINSTQWTKTITSDKFPAEFGVMCDFGTKSESELNKEKYDLTCELKFSCSTNKGATYANNYTVINEKEVAKKKVESTLSKLKGKSFGFKITENGVPTEANNLKYD